MQDDQGDDIATALDRLHAGGWSVGDTAFYFEGGGNCARRHRLERREPDPGRGRDGRRGVATDTKKNGLTLPTGIFQSTTPPESAKAVQIDPPQPAGQGGVEQVDDAGGSTSKAAKPQKKKTAVAAGSVSVEGWKLYLTEDVRFRLRMLAFQRGKKISTVANEILDRNLPRWTLERTE
jgi:hypothetical protein